MDDTYLWLFAGFVLVIAEVVTGTFYLLVLGLAAFAGALVAFLGLEPWAQALSAAAVAVAGFVWVYHWRRRTRGEAMRPVDYGQPASFEAWVNQAAGRARVKYRDGPWEARVQGEIRGEPGETLYVTAVQGSTLTVSSRPPQ